MPRRSRYFSILIVPDDGGKSIQFKVRSLTFKILLFTVFVFIVGAGLSIVFTGRIAAKLQMVEYLARENISLKEKNKKIDLLAKDLAEIKRKESKIRMLATSLMGGKDIVTEEKFADTISRPDREVDAFVSMVQRRQKGLALSTGESGLTRQNQMLSAVPTLRPVDGWITRGFQSNKLSGADYNLHAGIDIATATGTPIMAAAGGLVLFAGWDKYFGKLVIINHGFGYETYYGHCSRILVKRGDLVERSETIALVGSSGRSTAPHLHYEIRRKGTSVDPLLFFIN